MLPPLARLLLALCLATSSLHPQQNSKIVLEDVKHTDLEAVTSLKSAKIFLQSETGTIPRAALVVEATRREKARIIYIELELGDASNPGRKITKMSPSSRCTNTSPDGSVRIPTPTGENSILAIYVEVPEGTTLDLNVNNEQVFQGPVKPSLAWKRVLFPHAKLSGPQSVIALVL
jgi:hypothetical protein